MSYLAECDRCGVAEPVRGTMVVQPARLLTPVLRPGLPDGWSRHRLPDADGSARERELCGDCRADLVGWLGVGAPEQRTAHEPRAADPAAVARGAEGDSPQPESADCPVCGNAFLTERMPTHIRQQHPEEAKAADRVNSGEFD